MEMTDRVLQGAERYAVAELGMSWEELKATRTDGAVFLRTAVAEMLSTMGMTQERIGAALGRDHSSVCHMLCNIPALAGLPAYRMVKHKLFHYINNEETTKTQSAMLNGTISGNLGRDCESRTINGKEYTIFSVAAKTGREETTWIKVNYYGGGKVRDLLRKGAGVICTGRLSVGVYNEKPDITLWADNVEITKFAEPAERHEQEDNGNDLPWD